MQEGYFGIELETSSKGILWTVFERTRLHIEHFVNGKGKNIENIDILGLMYDEGKRSLFLNKSKYEKY